ncbi:uncharacterized protein ColSpa_00509 [Colletotrichum spaethianum]|uniref:Heterokaryon incompatibility domain-containing protein n=1 Tax=Colletotrichum spaethianum TaxID=700344 RepID=A0AA37NXR1_9PEZI|nr:uncharacterized protein ColSpa_00509 [Colletotrichum spaethianum]GKT40328.1 hypothetical protein ColSpa_00509 [Colletotrichum spaethianum]
MVEQCILPICLRKTSNGVTNFEPLVLEVELYYGLWGQKLQQVKAWDRRFCNIPRLNQWLLNCTDQHGHQCNVPVSQTQLPAGFRLIDTTLQCVARVKDVADFVALSYQWRTATAYKDRDLQLTKANVEELERPYCLRDSLIPEVISDAMQLCREIGRRYLWVDRMCIVQDDEGLKVSQIQAMDTIYQQAFVTIVACADGVGAGLPGLCCRPRRQNLKNRWWNFGIDGHYVGASMVNTTQVVDSSEWNTRAWTYQERILSRRHIFFSDVDVFVSCFHVSSRLDVGEAEHDYNLRRDLQSNGHGFETGLRRDESYYGGFIEMYGVLTETYTRRILSYRADILNAFDGVCRLFCSLTNTVMLFGIPERFMLQGLLWGHEGTKGLATEPLGLPTWTWAAWEGQVNFRDHPLRFLQPLSRFHFGNLVSIFYCDQDRGVSRLRPLEEERLWFNSQPLEGGHANAAQQVLWNTTNKSRAGDDPVAVWTNCVHGPLNALEHVDIDDITRARAEAHPHCLAFNTTVASLRLGLLPSDEEDNGTDTHIRMGIYSQQGGLVGETALMDRRWAQKQFDAEAYHVFALAAGHMFKSADREEVFFSGKYPFFRPREPWSIIVMIASREGPFYSRLALGRVSPATWTSVNPRWEPVILV